MDELLDRIWGVIEGGLSAMAGGMDVIISPLEALGPAWVILILAFATVALTRLLTGVYRTRRHDALKKEFLHWQSVREEAMKAKDPDKGKAMARNIDQAKLNKVYYDYFFEGLMKNLVTTVLPVLITIAYLSRTYTKESLTARFGDPWIFTIGSQDPVRVGTLFWYLICLFIGFILFGLAASFKKKERPIKGNFRILSLVAAGGLLLAEPALAIQLHQGSEGIIVHQVGHLFFLLSMVALISIITGRGLNREKGWRMILYSAALFVAWNLDTITAHFFDNQIRAVAIENLSLWKMKITANSGSEFLILFYHSLKLDHLFCVPAIYLFYRGLSNILAREKFKREQEDTP